MRALGAAAVASLVAGAALVFAAVLEGRATLSLIVIVPVVSGASGEFLLGVALLVLGLFLLPWGLAEPEGDEPLLPAPAPSEGGPTSGAGGVILLGPVPVFFGSWRNVSRRTRWIAALVGAAVLVLFVVGWVLAST